MGGYYSNCNYTVRPSLCYGPIQVPPTLFFYGTLAKEGPSDQKIGNSLSCCCYCFFFFFFITVLRLCGVALRRHDCART